MKSKNKKYKKTFEIDKFYNIVTSALQTLKVNSFYDGHNWDQSYRELKYSKSSLNMKIKETKIVFCLMEVSTISRVFSRRLGNGRDF